jgi:hypothetical protein
MQGTECLLLSATFVACQSVVALPFYQMSKAKKNQKSKAAIIVIITSTLSQFESIFHVHEPSDSYEQHHEFAIQVQTCNAFAYCSCTCLRLCVSLWMMFSLVLRGLNLHIVSTAASKEGHLACTVATILDTP